MEIKILEAEARAIDALCEEFYKAIDSDSEMTASEVKKKKEIIDNFVRVILDKITIVKENPTISLRELILGKGVLYYDTGTVLSGYPDGLKTSYPTDFKISLPQTTTGYELNQPITIKYDPNAQWGSITYSNYTTTTTIH